MDFNEAETWVRIALFLFFVILIFMKVPANIWKSLGDKGLEVRAELDEAVRIRQEAQELLNRIKLERQAAELKAKELVAQAEEQARLIAEEAKLSLNESIARRQQLAERKIAQAEAEAEAQVKAAAADMAANLAQVILMERVQSLKSDPMIDKAISQIDKRIA